MADTSASDYKSTVEALYAEATVTATAPGYDYTAVAYGKSFKTTRLTWLFGMRGWDPGASAFRAWTATDFADFSQTYYTGPGAGTLTGITVAWRTLAYL